MHDFWGENASRIFTIAVKINELCKGFSAARQVQFVNGILMNMYPCTVQPNGVIHLVFRKELHIFLPRFAGETQIFCLNLEFCKSALLSIGRSLCAGTKMPIDTFHFAFIHFNPINSRPSGRKRCSFTMLDQFYDTFWYQQSQQAIPNLFVYISSFSTSVGQLH